MKIMKIMKIMKDMKKRRILYYFITAIPSSPSR